VSTKLKQLAILFALATAAMGQNVVHDQTKPLPLSEPRPSAATVEAWKSRRFGMFIHFGLYSELGGVWNGKKINNGYSEQIMANAPIPRDQYAALAKSFDPEKFDADAIVALAKAAGMRFIVVTAKHHDGFAMFETKQSEYNIVDATPYHRDVVKELADACARGGLKFGVYYSTIDWHAPTGSAYIDGNSNPISDAHAAFNVAQLKELLTGYGPLSEIWFDMGKPTPEQSKLFAQTVHRLQPQTMVSGRVFNYVGDFTVMGDNEVPQFAIDEPWQTPASIFADTWGYRSWERRGEVTAKVQEKILELVTVVSRGGNYILNIGPEGDGSVVPFEADVLRGVGVWLKSNGDAVFGQGSLPPAASPFRSLDFGFATVSKDKLYLFVKNVPRDGKLHLPGVNKGVTFGDAYLLAGGAGASGKVVLNEGGAEVEAGSLLQGRSVGFMPVVVVPFSGRLKVRSAAIVAATADGSLTLDAARADRFLNYNGRGYEDPATTYKLRWEIEARPGRYKVAVHYAKSEKAGVMDLIAGTERTEIQTKAGQDAGVWTGEMTLPRGTNSLELTPKEPFFKGDKLPVKVESVQLRPLALTKPPVPQKRK
jgi:alpha-L-fucosidase